MHAPDATPSVRPRPWVGEPPLPSAAPWLYSGVIFRRSIAYLVDVLIIAILGFCLAFALSVIGFLSFGLLGPLAIIIMALWPMAYQIFFIATRGATQGMRLFGIELRDWSGKTASSFCRDRKVIVRSAGSCPRRPEKERS